MNPSASANLLTPYETFLERSANFRELNILPVPFGHFGENVTVEDLVKNKASWHRSCHKKFEKDKFDRAKSISITLPLYPIMVNCDLQRNQICYTFLLRKVSKILPAHLMLWSTMVLP